MRRLLCRLLGHVRWQRDGRCGIEERARYRSRAMASAGDVEEFQAGPWEGTRWRFLNDRAVWAPVHRAVLEAQHYLAFTRSWRCWRCREWVWEP